MRTTHTTIDTPLGELTLVAEDGALSGVYFPGHWTRPNQATFGERAEHGFEEFEQQLSGAYHLAATGSDQSERADGV